VVGYTEDGQRVVGQIAQRQAILNPESTIHRPRCKGMPNPKGSAGDLYVIGIDQGAQNVVRPGAGTL
jgi:hypothetical protein